MAYGSINVPGAGKTALGEAQVLAQTAQSAADAAQRAAGTAQSTADAAQSAADTAQRAADTAQHTAETAQQTAAAAQHTAETAQQTADTVQRTSVPLSRKINGKPLTGDITLNAADVNARPASWTPTAAEVGAAASNHTHTAAQVGAAAVNHTHTAAQVGARASNWLPTLAELGAAAAGHTHTASQMGAVPATRKVNGKALSADVSLTASDVGAAAANHTHAAQNTSPLVLLYQNTLSANATRFDLPLTGIDWDAYGEILIYAHFKTSADNYLSVYINNLTGASDYSNESSNTSSLLTVRTGSQFIDCNCRVPRAYYGFTARWSVTRVETPRYSPFYTNYVRNLNQRTSAVSMNFVPQNNASILAGSRFTILGIRA